MEYYYAVSETLGKLQITPATITAVGGKLQKWFGTDDPTNLGYGVNPGPVAGEVPMVVGNPVRDEGEELKSNPGYVIHQGTLHLEDNGAFKASNYTLKFEEGDFAIVENQNLVLNAEGYEGVYDGNSHTGIVNSYTTVPETINQATIEYRPVGALDDAWTTEVPTIKNVGEATYEVRATQHGYVTRTATITLKVTKKQIRLTSGSFSKPYDSTAITNGNSALAAQEVWVADDTLDDGGSWVLVDNAWAEGDAASYVFTNNSVVNVADSGGGNNSFYATKLGETDFDNYDITYAYGDLTINPRPVVVRANDAGKTFGDPEPTLTATPGGVEGNADSGLIGNETVSYTVNRVAGENAGSYVITASGAESQGNYRVTYEPATFTIANSDENIVTGVNLADAAGTTKVYNGVASSVTATATVAGSTFEYSLDGTNWSATAPSFVNAGTYSVWVRANAANYNTTAPVRATVSITPAPVTITATAATKVAGTADPGFTGTVTGLVGTDTLGVQFIRTNAAEGAGIYPNVISATYLANPNYTVTVVPAAFTITAAPVVPTPPTPGPGPAAPVTPAPAAAPAPEPPAAAAAVAIDDEPTPLTTLPETNPQRTAAIIEDEETPLTAFDDEDPDCWVHLLMILGILLTILYAGAVVARRTNFSRGLKSREEDFAGQTEEQPQTTPAGAVAAVQE